MSIRWPAIKLPPINLWNAPSQEALRREIRAMRIQKLYQEICAENAAMRCRILDGRIKEKERLYYLRCGRFPE